MHHLYNNTINNKHYPTLNTNENSKPQQSHKYNHNKQKATLQPQTP